MLTKSESLVRKNLKFSEYGPDMVKTSGKTRWLTHCKSAKSADDLTFTSRDNQGRINWWDVAVPKTNYWHVHHMLGRAYAFEVLDFLNNPEAENVNGGELGFICSAIARWLPSVAGTAATGMADGFYGAISEFVTTGTVAR